MIDPISLTVSEPVTAALDETGGHGKLLYAEELGTQYYATNTNNPGVFPINGDDKTTSEMVTLCDLSATGHTVMLLSPVLQSHQSYDVATRSWLVGAAGEEEEDRRKGRRRRKS